MSQRYTPRLVSLTYVRLHRGMQTAEVADDDLIKELIDEASTDFQYAIGRTCMPYIDTREFDFQSSYKLDLDDDLLAITTLTNGDDNTIASTEYVLRPSNEYPKRRIRMKNGSTERFTFVTSPEEALSVEGTWGYVPQYLDAWKNVTTLASDIADATTTSVSVTSADDIDVWSYIQVESEVMFVESKAANVLTVVRGKLGTTAAAHTGSLAVSTFQVLGDIRSAVRDAVVWKYTSKDRIGARVQVFQSGTVVVEDLQHLQPVIERHTRMIIESV